MDGWNTVLSFWGANFQGLSWGTITIPRDPSTSQLSGTHIHFGTPSGVLGESSSQIIPKTPNFLRGASPFAYISRARHPLKACYNGVPQDVVPAQKKHDLETGASRVEKLLILFTPHILKFFPN